MPRFNQHKYGRFLTARGGGWASCSFSAFSLIFSNFTRLKDIRVTGNPGLGDTGIRESGSQAIRITGDPRLGDTGIGRSGTIGENH